jgi:hypothetical protein
MEAKTPSPSGMIKVAKPREGFGKFYGRKRR